MKIINGENLRKTIDLKEDISEVVVHDISQDKIIKQIDLPQID